MGVGLGSLRCPSPHLWGSTEAEVLDAGRSEQAQCVGAWLRHRAEQKGGQDWRCERCRTTLGPGLKLLASLGVTHRLTPVLPFVISTSEGVSF